MATVATLKTIDIESDIYSHLLQNTSEFGETPSSVLRRLLGLTSTSSVIPPSHEKSELLKLLASTEFVYAKGVVGRFLVVLRWLHHRDPEGFAKVENIKGRGRLYFAKDARTLHAAGRSVNPKQIPGAPYWVITTTPTDLKQEILERVMREPGYSLADIKAATQAIAR